MTTIKTLSGFQVQELHFIADLYPELNLTVNKTTAQVPDLEATLKAVLDMVDALATQRAKAAYRADYQEVSTLKGRNNALHSVKRKLQAAIKAEQKIVRYLDAENCPTCDGTGIVTPNGDGYDGCPTCNHGDGPTGQKIVRYL